MVITFMEGFSSIDMCLLCVRLHWNITTVVSFITRLAKKQSSPELHLNISFRKQPSITAGVNSFPPAFTNVLAGNNKKNTNKQAKIRKPVQRKQYEQALHISALTVLVTVKISSVYTTSSPEGQSPSKSYSTRT